MADGGASTPFGITIPRQGQADAQRVAALEIGRHVDAGGLAQGTPLDGLKPRSLDPPALLSNELRHEHAARRHHVGNASRRGKSRRHRRGPEEHRVEMDNVMLADGAAQVVLHVGRVVQAPQALRPKVADAYAIDFHRPVVHDLRVAWAVDTRGADLHRVTERRERLAQTVDRIDRSTVTSGGEIRGYDVEHPHHRATAARGAIDSACRRRASVSSAASVP